MSPSYSVLAAALVGVAGLAGGTHLLASDNGDRVGTSDVVAAEPVTDEPVAVADPSRLIDDEISSGDLADDVRRKQGLEPVAVIDPDCSLSIRLELGDTDPEVACLESPLIAAGALGEVAPDPATCPASGRSAVVDRFNQRSWLCEQGEITEVMPITSAISQPDPGIYEVYAKDLDASSNLAGEYSTMTHFVAFTYGEYRGARIAFHSIPQYSSGEYVQPLDSVGSQALFGESSGCIRVLPDHAELIWGWLDIGDTVKVIT